MSIETLIQSIEATRYTASERYTIAFNLEGLRFASVVSATILLYDHREPQVLVFLF